MSSPSRYRVTITRRGPPPRPFGWEICRCDDSTEVERSPDTFRSRHEAIADGERAAAALEDHKSAGDGLDGRATKV